MTSKVESPIWYVNFSAANRGRTTDVRLFYRLTDAREFLSRVGHGYIMRTERGGARVVEVKDFEPSPTEQRRIEGILDAWNGEVV